MRIACIAVAGTALLVAALAGADERSDLRAIGEGRALYLTNCASCHGTDATGLNGRDLTGISQRDRAFDRTHVANHIQGRRDGMASKTMPTWRVAFTRTWPGGQVAVDLNTLKLVRYLEFVQAAPPTTVATTEPR
jgi:mono/diheme cytochrome c family protein